MIPIALQDIQTSVEIGRQQAGQLQVSTFIGHCIYLFHRIIMHFPCRTFPRIVGGECRYNTVCTVSMACTQQLTAGV